MENNKFGPLLRYWRFIERWVDDLAGDVKQYVANNEDKKDIDVLQFDCDIFDQTSREMLEHLSSFGSLEQQTRSVTLLATLMGSTYVMGRWQGSNERAASIDKTQADHLAEARKKLTPLSNIKISVVKDMVADLWERKPEFIGNVSGTSYIIRDKANTAIKFKWWALDESERRKEPIDDLQTRAMQTWVKRASEALRKEGRFAGL